MKEKFYRNPYLNYVRSNSDWDKGIPERFKCRCCGALDNEEGIGGWSVHTELWQKYGTGMMCMKCFELKLGRRLTASDFTESGDNYTNSYVKLIRSEPSRP